MQRKSIIIAFMLLVIGVVAISIAEMPQPPGNPPANGIPSGGSPPSGGSGSAAPYTLNGSYVVNGEEAEESNKIFNSDTPDLSAIYVTNGGTLTLTNPIITTSGNTSSSDASSFYGLNGAILANNGSTVTVNGGTITTSGSGANGAIPTGTGTLITLSHMTITASGDGGHGVMATLGGALTLTDVDIVTTGAHGAPIATDRGSGTVNVTRGTIFSSGQDSPGIYSTGIIRIADADITSEGTEAAVIEGVNSIELTNTTLKGGVEKTGGVMIYQSFSGDAETGTGRFSITGGSYTATEGPAFFITNTDARINLTGAEITCASDVLVKGAGTSRWGKEGSNGGTVTLTADGETLKGSLVTDEISSITAILINDSSLTGAINSASLTVDESSTWTVTGESNLTTLKDPAGISGASITNIIGNGNNVFYNKNLPENSELKGQTYTLVNGGSLIPQ